MPVFRNLIDRLPDVAMTCRSAAAPTMPAAGGSGRRPEVVRLRRPLADLPPSMAAARIGRRAHRFVRPLLHGLAPALGVVVLLWPAPVDAEPRAPGAAVLGTAPRPGPKPSGKEPPPPAGPADAPTREAGAEVVLRALGFLGVPYRWGGDDPVRGFDCSGLVRYVFDSAFGLQLPRRSDAMWRVGRPVARGALQPGDLLFFNTLRRPYTHVGIYIGEGRIVHAPARGGVVRIESVEEPYWRARYNGARRIDPVGDAASAAAAARSGPSLDDPEPPGAGALEAAADAPAAAAAGGAPARLAGPEAGP